MMVQRKVTDFSFTLLFLCLFILSCSDASTNEKGEKIIADPEQIDKAVRNSIEQLIGIALDKKGNIDDSSTIRLLAVVNSFYQGVDFENQWSKKEKWLPLADSLVQFIHQAEVYGLFPKDYHAAGLDSLKQQLDRDSVKRMDAVSWAKADVLLTDACITIIKDLKYGRLFYDSSTLSSDTTRMAHTLISYMKQLLSQPSLFSFMNSVEPGHRGYAELKTGIRYFLDSMDRRIYTYVVYPYKKNDAKDSLFFIKTLQKRLAESNCINFTNKLPDSAQLDQSIRNYQKLKGIKADGKLSASLVKLLNTSDAERFKRIAITLDRYKKLPDSMPQKFIWVNLPAYYLQLWDTDTLALESKIICGKTSTPTPLLNSAISDMITYPTWTVPTSIISKQYLPKLKNNPNYLSKLGLRLVNEKGESISASTVNWGKYTKGIPYKVMQNSGDNNALGVIKFNFSNPHAVYLHDTNQRYLFKNASRAFSHGCVRVQEWEKLAMYIARNDSMNLKPGDTLRYTTDSIRNWLAEKKHKRIAVKNRLPLYITYFSCEGKNGKIKFYEDIYGDDKAMREKFFSNK